MPQRSITISDVSAITGMTRFQLRNLLASLPGFRSSAQGTGSANTYSLQDLAVLAVCAELDQRFGLRRDVIGLLASPIRRAFSGPKPMAQGAFLQLMPWSSKATYCTSDPAIAEGLVLAIDPIVLRIDQHLTSHYQPNLTFGPVAISELKQPSSRTSRQEGARAVRSRGKE